MGPKYDSSNDQRDNDSHERRNDGHPKLVRQYAGQCNTHERAVLSGWSVSSWLR
jgi:hypothetical protein